jgi:hypothetical protein
VHRNSGWRESWFDRGYRKGYRFARNEADYDELAAVCRAGEIPSQWDLFRADILNRHLGDKRFDFKAYSAGFARACIELYEKNMSTDATEKGPIMTSGKSVTIDAMSEAEFEPVLELLHGGDPKAIARKAGISPMQLIRMRDDLMAQVDRQRAQAVGGAAKKIGRNEPCPCGSGKKYKHCCLNRHQPVRQANPPTDSESRSDPAAEQAQLIKRIEKTFGLLGKGRYFDAIDRASKWILRYPDEDRFHDILATGYFSVGRYETAVEICRRRLAVAESEKSYFIQNGRYRDAQLDKPSLSYHYPPLTWLQKYWIALKLRDYQALNPSCEDKTITRLVQALQTVDDTTRFPEKSVRGLDMRRMAMEETLVRLKTIGPEVIPYLLPVAGRYSWAGLFVPEIIAAYSTDLAFRSLIDISMCGFAYASGASLHHLEQRGDVAVSHIAAAFTKDKKFDAIKTGIVSVLGNIGTPSAYQILLDLLSNDSPHIVNWAGGALGKFNCVDALPAIVAANSRIGGERMIEKAIEGLRDLEGAT